MMLTPVRTCAIAISCLCIFSFTNAQDPGPLKPFTAEKKPARPFKILTSGRHITIQSNKDISKIMVWSASGHRFVEQTNVNAPTCNFDVPQSERFVFMMLELEGGKRFTEKIGVQ